MKILMFTKWRKNL